MSDGEQDRFLRLIKILKLHDIRPMDLHSSRRGEIPATGSELQLVWKQALADEDPLFPDAETVVFRPKYEFLVKHSDAAVFEQISVFVIAFKISDRPLFDSLWADSEVKELSYGSSSSEPCGLYSGTRT